MLKQKKSIRDSVYIWGTGNGANVAVMYCIENDIRIEGFILILPCRYIMLVML